MHGWGTEKGMVTFALASAVMICDSPSITPISRHIYSLIQDYIRKISHITFPVNRGPTVFSYFSQFTHIWPVYTAWAKKNVGYAEPHNSQIRAETLDSSNEYPYKDCVKISE
eukprot:sb/3477106/